MPNTRIYWLHTLSPTHAGIGRGVGYIDLPIDLELAEFFLQRTHAVMYDPV